MEVCKGIEVQGLVQGVGFRPHVYRLATERSLAGQIRNTSTGVDIEIQGEAAAVEDFLARLTGEAPPLVRITGLRLRDLPRGSHERFRIVESRRGEPVRTLISPDVAICADCLRELFDPRDRRYRYPFINCTNCGPRFTIVRDIPYDRAWTSMASFRMCPECQAEYDDPADRRFHAQPNACWACGPRVELWDAGGRRLEAEDPIAGAAARLRAGAVIAVKGLGGFHLAVEATDARAVERLRERKRRVGKPFAVMVPDLATAERLCELDATARALLEQVQRPVVLVPRRPGGPVAAEVAPALSELGLFLPYTPLHHLLFAAGGFPALVMTSANLSEEPIAIANDEALGRLRGIADGFLVHDRDILLRCDDSVVRCVAGELRSLRRSRGYVPAPIELDDELPPVLGVGGELKNTICLTRGRHAFLSQHIGDLENLEGYRFFEEAIQHLRRILEMEPGAIAHDLHPDYFSTRWALAQDGMRKVGVQHHHAHVASCMAENGLQGRVIGLVLDGTGYGDDGHLWGGEVLLADYLGFERVAHLEYVRMPGGAAAIREPWRMAVSYLVHHLGADAARAHAHRLWCGREREVRVVLRMLERGVNTPHTSSCGRLFDAVAALVGVREQVSYEAQAAIELETVARASADTRVYDFAVAEHGDRLIVSARPMIEELLADLERRVPAAAVARRFHLGLVEVLREVVGRIGSRAGLDRVCLSGGSCQNLLLLEHLLTRLSASGMRVFTHRQVPAGDGGISLGQAVVAANLARVGR